MHGHSDEDLFHELMLSSFENFYEVKISNDKLRRVAGFVRHVLNFIFAIWDINIYEDIIKICPAKLERQELPKLQEQQHDGKNVWHSS